MYFGGNDSLILLIIPIILAWWAQASLKRNFETFSRVRNSRGMSGAEIARYILDRHGLSNVTISEGQGFLSDYFDPTRNHINLSSSVYNGNSIASAAVAAHEVGHAIQYQEKFSIIGLRNKLLPVTQFSSSASWVAIMIGVFSGMTGLLWFGAILLIIIAVFQLVTLPIEFDASKRALANLEQYNLLMNDEIVPARKVLKSAAMTYVVGLIAAIAQVVRIILITQRRS